MSSSRDSRAGGYNNIFHATTPGGGPPSPAGTVPRPAASAAAGGTSSASSARPEIQDVVDFGAGVQAPPPGSSFGKGAPDHAAVGKGFIGRGGGGPLAPAPPPGLFSQVPKEFFKIGVEPWVPPGKGDRRPDWSLEVAAQEEERRSLRSEEEEDSSGPGKQPLPLRGRADLHIRAIQKEKLSAFASSFALFSFPCRLFFALFVVDQCASGVAFFWFRLGPGCRLRTKMSSAEWAFAGSQTTSGTESALMFRGDFLSSLLLILLSHYSVTRKKHIFEVLRILRGPRRQEKRGAQKENP